VRATNLRQSRAGFLRVAHKPADAFAHALWRIKQPEGLKEHSPQDLGRVLGFDRAPEVKTLRRKLTRLAAVGKATQFGQALARQRVSLRGEALGFPRIDGHVRVYHGKHALPKAHVTRMRISLPAASDYWVNQLLEMHLAVARHGLFNLPIAA
jgi:hypothetical protein